MRTVLGADVLPKPRRAVERFGVPAVLFVAATALALFRVPVENWDILWAEDGQTFLTGAYGQGPGVVFQPYAGYLHLFPRLATEFAVAVAPVGAVSTVMYVIGALLTAGVATSAYLFFRQRIDTVLVQLALWLQVAILPIAGGEVADSIANSHWYLVFGAFLACLVTPRGRLLIVLQSIVIAVAIMSDPLTLIVLGPFIFIRLLALPRGGRENIIAWVYIGAAVVQAAVTVLGTLVQHTRTFGAGLVTLPGFSEMYAGRVALTSLIGVRGTSAVGDAPSDAVKVIVLVAALVLLLGLFAWVIVTDPARRYLVIAAAVASVVMSLLCFTLVWGAMAQAGPFGLDIGSRYAVVPGLMLFTAVCVSVDSAVARIGRRGLRLLPAIGLLALVAVVGANDYRVWDSRAGVVDWPDTLASASEACDNDPQLQTAPLQIAPSWFTGTVVPCDVLTDGR